jgi:glycosyltransferase involved in cell wall biosynthesis
MDLLFAESSVSGWGTEQHFAALAIAMMRRSHQVRCLLSEGSPLTELLGQAGVPVTLSGRRGNSSLDIDRLRTLRATVAKHRPDWIVTNDPRYYWPLLLTGRPHGARTALFRHWEYMSRSRLSRRLLPRLADRFILVSRFQREHLRRGGVDVGRMQILYNPIDTERFAPTEEARARGRAALGVDDGEIVIGYIGRMLRDKGVFTLLAASGQLLSQAPGARIVWVGDGTDLPELRARAQASTHAASHHFAGVSEDMPGIYNALDLLVVPSEYPEPFGRVSAEAQACGVATVCSNAGGLPETFLPGISGRLVPKGEAAPLAVAILELAGDAALRRTMGRAGRRFVCANFSLERVAASFEATLADRRYDQRITDVPAEPSRAA